MGGVQVGQLSAENLSSVRSLLKKKTGLQILQRMRARLPRKSMFKQRLAACLHVDVQHASRQGPV